MQPSRTPKTNAAAWLKNLHLLTKFLIIKESLLSSDFPWVFLRLLRILLFFVAAERQSWKRLTNLIYHKITLPKGGGVAGVYGCAHGGGDRRRKENWLLLTEQREFVLSEKNKIVCDLRRKWANFFGLCSDCQRFIFILHCEYTYIYPYMCIYMYYKI